MGAAPKLNRHGTNLEAGAPRAKNVKIELNPFGGAEIFEQLAGNNFGCALISRRR